MPGSTRVPSPPARDPHVLYERAVQNPDGEIDLVLRLLRRRHHPARRLREDFSGTAAIAARWVERGRDRTALAVDLDPAVHAWAQRWRVPSLGDAASRLSLVTADVREANGRGFDAILALNFSYGVFRTREALRGYLAGARRALAPGGVVVLDAFGGWDAQKPLVERRRIGGGLTYVWEQESFDPITHRIRCAIHFERKGRRILPRAFTYDWRLWTVPELQELFMEAGLRDVEVVWDVAEGSDTRYVPRRSAAAQAGWIAYVVGRRSGGDSARGKARTRASRP